MSVTLLDHLHTQKKKLGRLGIGGLKMSSSENVGIKIYRRKPIEPIEIAAIRWTGKNLKKVIDFIGLHESVKDIPWENYEMIVKRHGLKVFTPQWIEIVPIGYFIIKDIRGELTLQHPIVLDEEYEEVKNDAKTRGI